MICCAAVFAEQIQELLDRLAVPAGCRPHQPAGVMVDHDSQVLLTLADRDLIEPEPLEVREHVATAFRLGGDALADTSDRPPRDPHQLADRALARVHRQPRCLVIKRAGEPGVVTRPRHRGDDHPVLAALDPRRVSLQIAERRAEIQRPPPATALAEVIARAAPAAVRAAIPLAVPRPDRDHDRAVLLVDCLDDRLLQPQHPRPRTDAYASACARRHRFLSTFLTVRSRNGRSDAACALLPGGRAHPCAPTSLPNSAARRRLSSSANPGTSSQNASRTAPAHRALLDQTTTAALPSDRVHSTHGRVQEVSLHEPRLESAPRPRISGRTTSALDPSRRWRRRC